MLPRNNKINNQQAKILFVSYFIGYDGYIFIFMVIYNQIMLNSVENNLFVVIATDENIIFIHVDIGMFLFSYNIHY